MIANVSEISEIKFSLEFDDKTKTMTFSPAWFDKWFEVA